MVSAITRLNDYGILIGRGVTWHRKARLAISDWTDRFVAVLVRKVFGPHIEKSRNGLEMCKRVGGNWWWQDVLIILFRCSVLT